jgi:anti-sigma factor RsiW
MTPNQNFQINKNPDFTGDLLANNTGETNQSICTMDMLKRDRFELLSAYLDGEITAAERREVENWLANDPEIQRLYARLLNLRQSMRTMPAPPTAQPVEHAIEQVYQRMHRRSRRRAVIWGGSAIAAVFIGAVSSVLPNLQVARSPHAHIEPLMVALNDPVVEIPRAAIAPPQKPSQPMESLHQHNKDFN